MPGEPLTLSAEALSHLSAKKALGCAQCDKVTFLQTTIRFSAENEVCCILVICLQAMQGFGLGLLLRKFDEKSLIRWATFGLIWAWLLMVSSEQKFMCSKLASPSQRDALIDFLHGRNDRTVVTCHYRQISFLLRPISGAVQLFFFRRITISGNIFFVRDTVVKSEEKKKSLLFVCGFAVELRS